MTDGQAIRRVLRHYRPNSTAEPIIAKWTDRLDRNDLHPALLLWLGFEVQRRASGYAVAVPALPATAHDEAMSAFVTWRDAADEHHYSGKTLAWAMFHALAALLEPRAPQGAQVPETPSQQEQ